MDLSKLLDLAGRHHTRHADRDDPVPGLSIYSRQSPSEASDIEAYLYEPVLCLVLQGSKSAALRDRQVVLEPGHALLVSHHLPVISQIIRASDTEPYLAIILSLDLQLVRSLYSDIADLPVSAPKASSLATAAAEASWIAPLERYLALLDNPLDAKVLGPSIIREIHYRLLLSPIGGMLRKFLLSDSHESRIAAAIQMLRQNYSSAIRIGDLARAAGMSISSFHEHFKSVTGSTPIQYQKDLRLIQARELLTGSRKAVSQAAFAVGYQSPSQFSRDYSRAFGVPPSKDCFLIANTAE